jgi:CheY-like chemotaxis protein
MASAFQPLVPVADDWRERSTVDTKPASRFLIVDDEAEVRDLFTRLLRFEGYEVHAVATADAGLDAVAEWRPDAILVDYVMPFVNGIGFLYRLRARESASRTPVAVITGARDVEGALSSECARLGAAVYFKPIGRNDLRNLARALLASNGHPYISKRG